MFFGCSEDTSFQSQTKKKEAEKEASKKDPSGGSAQDASGDPFLPDELGGSNNVKPQEDDDLVEDNNLGGDKDFKKCFERQVATDIPIEADVYKLPPETSSLPDFSTMTPVDRICMDNFDIPDRDFTLGFPGVKSLVEWFAIDAHTNLIVETEGTYEFSLASDDGARLFIDDTEIIDNDGTHPVRTKNGSIFLTKGKHKLVVKYFQGPATRIALQLFWKVPGSAAEVIVPQESFIYEN